MSPIASVDDATAVWIATHRWSPANEPFVWLGDIDRLGAVWIVLALAIGVARRWSVLRTLVFGIVAALTTFAADSASFGVKDLVQRKRPFVAHPEIHPLYKVHSSSFPAGHAATSFAGAALLIYLAWRAAPFFLGLAAAISFSRVYVGVHYPGDVLAGAGIGILVGLMVVLLLTVFSDRIGELRTWPWNRDPSRRATGARSRGSARPSGTSSG